MISVIVAKSQNGVIGVNNKLPWYLPADLKRFKEITVGHTVVMGRKTFQSIIARLGKPLPNRRNIVLTRDESYAYPRVEVIHSLSDLLDIDEELHVIGGAEIYRQLIDRVDRLYMTEVKANIDGDTYFPAIDMCDWREVSREQFKADDKNQYDFDFVVYDRP